MKKLIFLLFLLTLPTINAHFVFSDIEISIGEIPPIPLGKEVVTEANVTFRWGFGAIPLPINIYLKAENVPDWLSVKISPDKFTITPTKFIGGEKSQLIKIELSANKETKAYSIESFTLYAYTNGSLIIKGCEKRKEIFVTEDFIDKGLTIEAPSAVPLYIGEERIVYLNVTNNCNADINVIISAENATGFSLSFAKKILSISSKSRESVRLKIGAEKIGEADATIKLTYYPIGHEEKTNYEEYVINLISEAKAGQGGAIAIGLIIVIVGIIIFVIWKKKA